MKTAFLFVATIALLSPSYGFRVWGSKNDCKDRSVSIIVRCSVFYYPSCVYTMGIPATDIYIFLYTHRPQYNSYLNQLSNIDVELNFFRRQINNTFALLAAFMKEFGNDDSIRVEYECKLFYMKCNMKFWFADYSIKIENETLIYKNYSNPNTSWSPDLPSNMRTLIDNFDNGINVLNSSRDELVNKWIGLCNYMYDVDFANQNSARFILNEQDGTLLCSVDRVVPMNHSPYVEGVDSSNITSSEWWSYKGLTAVRLMLKKGANLKNSSCEIESQSGWTANFSYPDMIIETDMNDYKSCVNRSRRRLLGRIEDLAIAVIIFIALSLLYLFTIIVFVKRNVALMIVSIHRFLKKIIASNNGGASDVEYYDM